MVDSCCTLIDSSLDHNHTLCNLWLPMMCYWTLDLYCPFLGIVVDEDEDDVDDDDAAAVADVN